MKNTHYMKREKEGRVIQLIIVVELLDGFGNIQYVKWDLEECYKKAFPFLRYPIPHEELTEISFDEFRELCRQHNCLTHQGMPAPGTPSESAGQRQGL